MSMTPGHMRQPARRGESGMALMLTLVTTLLTLIVSATIVTMALNEYQNSGVAETSRLAYQIASAAVEKAVYELKRDADWADSIGATADHTLGDTTTWYRLYDGAAFVENLDFPTASPLGRITVHLRGVSNAEVRGCNPETCIWARATGRVGIASRRVQVLLGKLTSADFTAYSATAINVGAGGGGNGAFTIHGALYVANCTNMNISGQIRCVGLNMQGDGAVYNDRASVGDTPGVTPYHNRVLVRGHVTGQGNSWMVGTPPQRMWGVHASGWAAAVDNQIHAYHRDNTVPHVPFPDPSVLIANQQVNRANAMTAYSCTQPGGVCTAAQWQAINLNSSAAVLTLAPGAKVVIPDQAAGIDCRGAQAPACSSATGADVPGTTNFSLVFNGFAGAGVSNLVTQRDAYLYMQARLLVTADVRYQAYTTVLIENTDSESVEIRASMTPVCPVSQAAACTQTFGQASGQTLAFAIGPSNPTTAGGGAYVRGAGLEINLIMMAHGSLHNDNPQAWHGLFIANQLDFDNNPQIYYVDGLRLNLPIGVGEHMRSAFFGVQFYRWEEIF